MGCTAIGNQAKRLKNKYFVVTKQENILLYDFFGRCVQESLMEGTVEKNALLLLFLI